MVADRCVMLPVKGSALRQVVVRIRSKQILTKSIPATKEHRESVVEGTDQEKDIGEYVVIQRRIMQGQEEPWLVWGTTQETSVDEVLGSVASKLGKKEAEVA